MRIQVSRGEQGAEFDNRRSYVTARTYGTIGLGARLCNAVEYAVSSGDRKSRFAPWVTPVLGSGCLVADDPVGGTRQIQHVPAIWAEAVLRERDLELKMAPSEAAQVIWEFASSLLTDRLDRRPESPPPSGLQPREGDLASALVVLAAALTNRLYHEIRSIDGKAHTRAHSLVAVLTRGSQRSVEIEEEVVEPLRSVLEVAKRLWTTNPSRADDHGVAGGTVKPASDEDRQRTVQYLTNVLDDIRKSVNLPVELRRGPHVDNIQVELISELAWFGMTYHTSTYPGWNDLLLRLSMLVGNRNGDRVTLRPRITDMTQPPRWITSRLQSVTEASWTSRVKRAVPSERDKLYRSVADLLRAQAARRVAGKREMPPFASAFVTSFDLELEMALWHSSGEPFVVAVPVLLVLQAEANDEQGEDPPSEVMSTWLGCLINPDHDLDDREQLRRIQESDDWFLLTEKNLNHRCKDLPVVVHLDGCPLLELPNLQASPQSSLLTDVTTLFRLADRGETGENVGLELKHAVLLDEYAAMQQATSEVFRDPSTGEKADEVRYGLPLSLTAGSPLHTRFWLVLGVQVNDTSVRLRLASQLAAPRWLAEHQNNRPEPNRAGVMVNRHTELASHELLYWSGFDVVHESCEQWREEIDHLVEHLEAGRRSERKEPCPLGHVAA